MEARRQEHGLKSRISAWFSALGSRSKHRTGKGYTPANKTKRALAYLLAFSMVFQFDGTTLVRAAAFTGPTENFRTRTADPTTMMTYTTTFGDESAGSRYMGRLWADKSVLAYGEAQTETGAGSSLKAVFDGEKLTVDGVEVSVDDDFMNVFSAMSSSQKLTGYATVPIDMVLTIDVSSSMLSGDDSDSRISKVVQAADEMIARLMEMNPYNRVGVVLFDDSPYVLVPLDHYEPANGYYGDPSWGDNFSLTNGYIDVNPGVGVHQNGDEEEYEYNGSSGNKPHGNSVGHVIAKDKDGNNIGYSNWYGNGSYDAGKGKENFHYTFLNVSGGYPTPNGEYDWGFDEENFEWGWDKEYLTENHYGIGRTVEFKYKKLSKSDDKLLTLTPEEGGSHDANYGYNMTKGARVGSKVADNETVSVKQITQSGTNVSGGYWLGLKMLADSVGTSINRPEEHYTNTGRQPVYLMLTDGMPNVATTYSTWWAPADPAKTENTYHTSSWQKYFFASEEMNILQPLMIAAYWKKLADAHYTEDIQFYTLGVGLSGSEVKAQVVMNPGAHVGEGYKAGEDEIIDNVQKMLEAYVSGTTPPRFVYLESRSSAKDYSVYEKDDSGERKTGTIPSYVDEMTDYTFFHPDELDTSSFQSAYWTNDVFETNKAPTGHGHVWFVWDDYETEKKDPNSQFSYFNRHYDQAVPFDDPDLPVTAYSAELHGSDFEDEFGDMAGFIEAGKTSGKAMFYTSTSSNYVAWKLNNGALKYGYKEDKYAAPWYPEGSPTEDEVSKALSDHYIILPDGEEYEDIGPNPLIDTDPVHDREYYADYDIETMSDFNIEDKYFNLNDDDNVMEAFEQIFSMVKSKAFDPIYGENDFGSETMMYADPIGLYMEVKPDAITGTATYDGADHKGEQAYDMILELFGETHGVVETCRYSKEMEEKLNIGTGSGTFVSDPDKSGVYWTNRETAIEFVPTIADDSTKLDNATYTFYRLDDAEDDRRTERLNPCYDETDNLKYRLSDVRIWVENTGNYNDPDYGTALPDLGYEQLLCLSVPSSAMPAYVTDIVVNPTDITYESNSSNPAAVPLRLFYATGIKDEAMTDDGLDIDVAALHPEFVSTHRTDDQSGVYFRSTHYSNTIYDKYTAYAGEFTRGDAAVSFTPSEHNRFYRFQTALPLYTNVYSYDGTNLKPIAAAESEAWKGRELKGIYKDAAAALAAGLETGDVVVLESDFIKKRDDAKYANEWVQIVIDYYRETAPGEGELVNYVVSRKYSEFESDTGEPMCWYNPVTEATRPFSDWGDGVTPDSGWVIAAAAGGFRVGNMAQMMADKDINRTETSETYYLPTVNNAQVVNLYLGNNGQIIVDNTRLAITKLVTDENGVLLEDDETEFTFDLNIKGHEGSFRAIQLAYHDPSGTSGSTAGHWDYVVDSVAVFADGDGFLMNPEGGRATVRDHTFKIKDGIGTAEGWDPENHRLVVQGYANRAEEGTGTDGSCFFPTLDQIDIYDATGTSKVVSPTEDMLPVVWATVVSGRSGKDAEYGNANKYENDFKSEANWKTTDVVFTGGKAQVTLKSGEGLVFANLESGNDYTVTETITEEQINQGYDLGKVSHHQQESNVDYDRTGNAVSGTGTSFSASRSGAPYTYTISGDTGADIECVHWVNIRNVTELTVEKQIEDKNGTQVEITPDDMEREFEFEITLKSHDGRTPLTDLIKYTVYEQDGTEDPLQTDLDLVLDATGKGSFTLKPGQKAVITGLSEEMGYSYTVKEIDNPNDRITFGGDHLDGTASGTVDGGADPEKVTFVNVKNDLNPAVVSLSVKKEIDDQVNKFNDEFPWTSHHFTFRIEPADGDNPASDPLKDGIDASTASGTGLEAVTKLLDEVEFTEPGTYTYTLTETPGAADEWGGHMDYDTARYTVVIEVTEDEPDLIADIEVTGEGGSSVNVDDIVFTNSYTDKVTISLTAVKHLLGRDLEDGEFEFKLTAGEYSDVLPSSLSINHSLSIKMPVLKDADKEFTFDYELTRPAATVMTATPSDPVEVSKSGTFKLSSGEVKTFSSLVTGTEYSITMRPEAGYEFEPDDGTFTGTIGNEDVKIGSAGGTAFIVTAQPQSDEGGPGFEMTPGTMEPIIDGTVNDGMGITPSEAQEQVRDEVKDEVLDETRDEAQNESEAQVETQAETESESKAEETKPETQAESQPETQAESQAETQSGTPAETQPAAVINTVSARPGMMLATPAIGGYGLFKGRILGSTRLISSVTNPAPVLTDSAEETGTGTLETEAQTQTESREEDKNGVITETESSAETQASKESQKIEETHESGTGKEEPKTETQDGETRKSDEGSAPEAGEGNTGTEQKGGNVQAPANTNSGASSDTGETRSNSSSSKSETSADPDEEEDGILPDILILDDGTYQIMPTILRGDKSPMPAGAESDGTLTVSNAEDGTISFGDITFDTAGTYKYTLQEVIPDPGDPDITYDETVYEITVVVVNDGAGGLKVEKVEYKSDSGSTTALNSAVFINKTTDFESVEKSAETSTGYIGEQPGGTITYTIAYENPGPDAVEVTITDTLEDYLEYVKDSAGTYGSYDEGSKTITWKIPDVQVGESGTVTFQAKIKEDVGTMVENTANVQFGTESPLTTNTVKTPIPHKTSNPESGAEVKVGEEITYTIEYENVSEDPADIHIRDVLDNGLEYVEDSAGTHGSYDAATRTVTWDLTDVPAGTSGTVSFKAKPTTAAIVKGAAESFVENTAEVDFGDGGYVKTETVKHLVKGKGKIKITKTIDDVYGAFGDPTFIFIVTNTDTKETFTRSITLSKDLLSDSVEIEVDQGYTYEIYEAQSSRYKLEAIHPGLNITSQSVSDRTATADLTAADEASVEYYNVLRQYEKLSHTGSVVNHISSGKSD